MPIYELEGKKPVIHSTAYVAPTATIIGDVEIEEDCSIWFNVVIRGDTDKIIIRKGTNIQDGTVIHTDPGYVVELGPSATIGHNCTIHGCIVEEEVVVGMGSTILNGARLKKQSFIAAHSLILENKLAEESTLYAGVPAKRIADITENQLERMRNGNQFYLNNGEKYKKNYIL